MPVAREKQEKNSKLRHTEYYDLQPTFDKLYADSCNKKIFNNLYSIIVCDENIKLAYRNIKRNSGSVTSGTDGITVNDIEKIPLDKFVAIVKKKFQWYKPKTVKRVEIPKPNGKTRPLGIPAMWDRVVQQCILQVLEPICEAKFHERSNGFRPNRSAEHAISQAGHMIQRSHLHYVVDIDIKGFFDNVNHSKLIKQMWRLGIQDKKLICIIKEMLKAPILLPNGEIISPEKGTPQGGILSPLLSNIVLNELDWWIASQWETFPTKHNYDQINSNGSIDRGNAYRALRSTNLKEIYIVRYADDFKIFCKNHNDANKIFIATKNWLWERLGLQISEEKSKVVNLKKGYSEFLGFKLKAIKRGTKYVVSSRVNDKALQRITVDLKEQIKKIATPINVNDEAKEVSLYNSMVMGIHNYYCIATRCSLDFKNVSRSINFVLKNRLRDRLKKQGTLTGFRVIRDKYGQSKQMRYIHDIPIIPIGYAQYKIPFYKKRSINIYTAEGRNEIHKKLGVNMHILLALMRMNAINNSIEYMDNRLSLYSAQNGKCAITGRVLGLGEIHCHHKIPLKCGGTDRYGNLIIVHENVHRLIHATNKDIVRKYLKLLSLTDSQIKKINLLREKAKLSKL